MVNNISEIEDAIIEALKADPRVDFPDGQIIKGHRDADTTRQQIAIGGIMTAYGNGRRSQQLAHGRAARRRIVMTVSVGRRATKSPGTIADDIAAVISCLQRQPIAGFVMSYQEDYWITTTNDVVWYQIAFEIDGLTLEE